MSAPPIAGANPIARQVSDGTRRYPVQGWVMPGFSAVAEAFCANFARGEETGAAVAVYHRGVPVVDLWGGYRDAACTEGWAADTLVNTMSVSKAMMALCIHLLADRGQIDLDAPVARYWPAFAANGKAGLLVRWVLDHRAGLPVVEPSPGAGRIYDWQAMTEALAAMAPLWPPGTQAGYHIRTQGFLLGELVRRISGQTPGAFFRSQIAAPLGLDFHIGLADADLCRVAEFIPAVAGTIFDRSTQDPASLLFRAGRELPQPLDYNGRDWRQAEIPSSNGHGDARSVARVYALLANGGTLDGLRLLAPETVARATSEQHDMTEQVMGRRYHQAMGFLRNSPPVVPMGPNPDAFGHHGVGGALGMADPARGLALGYVMNRMHARLDNGPRAGSLVAAALSALTDPATEPETTQNEHH